MYIYIYICNTFIMDLNSIEEYINDFDNELHKMIEDFLPEELAKENIRLHKERQILINLFHVDKNNQKILNRLLLNTEKIMAFNKSILKYVESMQESG